MCGSHFCIMLPWINQDDSLESNKKATEEASSSACRWHFRRRRQAFNSTPEKQLYKEQGKSWLAWNNYIQPWPLVISGTEINVSWGSKPALFLLFNHISTFHELIKVGVEAGSWHGKVGTLQSETPSQFLIREPGSQPEITAIWLLSQGLDKCSTQPERLPNILFLKTFGFLPDR